MQEQRDRTLAELLAESFGEKSFLRRLQMDRSTAVQLFSAAGWAGLAGRLEPIRQRVSCAEALALLRPLLGRVAPEPAEGWPAFVYAAAEALQFPREDPGHTPAQRDGALCALQFLQCVFTAERQALPFDPRFDFAFCTPEELAASGLAEEYRRFLACFRENYVYEMMRLGREVTPFRTLEHIAGVHHVAMSVSRAFSANGGLIDLALISGAAAGHDIGKFGCRPGERVPYLHYYYTDRWFAERNLNVIGHIAANHSVWDLEIENLSSESLVLVYADFRVKQSRDSGGTEISRIYSLADSFAVILGKLDNVDGAKRRRYRFVYAKLADFERYLISFGVDPELGPPQKPKPRTDPALMTRPQVVGALRQTAVDHNIRLMHRLGHDRLFGNMLESARSEQAPERIRAYVSVFEEYFTYWTAAQKEQTLRTLYELLLVPDGDIRLSAAALIGRILANFRTGYRKELPAGTAPDPGEDRRFELWAEYFEKLIHPDPRLTDRQISMIRYQAKTVVDTLLENSSETDLPRFAAELFRQYEKPEAAGPDAAFALMDAVQNLPLRFVSPADIARLAAFAAHWLHRGGLPQKAAALRLFLHLLPALPDGDPVRQRIRAEMRTADCSGSAPLQFLCVQVGRSLGTDVSGLEKELRPQKVISAVFLDNLKTATPWVLKAVGVEYLLDQVRNGDRSNVLHIATHFSNLMQVSENVVVRRMAGASLLALAPELTPDRRNEIAVELCKALESGETEISRYIPAYLGQFSLWLEPRELDEVIDQLQMLISSTGGIVASAALETVGSMLESYADCAGRTGEKPAVLKKRRERLAGLLMKGLASGRTPVRREALHILGEDLFASEKMSWADKDSLFQLCAKKLLTLLSEIPERELTFFYSAAALSHLYRFIVRREIDDGPFRFGRPRRAAFFPGTFDPFSLSHRGIVEDIRALGFEVYLAIDEFSWSKKAQPSLVRRQIVSMSVADMFDVYLFPQDIPVNLANPRDLIRLRELFAGRDLYLAVGSDVVENASSYRADPVPGSVHSMNHILFRRAARAGSQGVDADLSRLTGRVVTLQLPDFLEDVSSSRIRENIDLGRDISNLIDPAVQDYIYSNSLYQREPQYKQIIRASSLDFSYEEQLGMNAQNPAADAADGRSPVPAPDPGDSLLTLRDLDPQPRLLGFLTMKNINSDGLYRALGSEKLADRVRRSTSGRLLLLKSLYVVKNSGSTYDIGQLLLTEALVRAMRDDCSYAVWCSASPTSDAVTDLLQRQGFVFAGTEAGRPILLADMRSPSVMIQNVVTALKEPFASNSRVLSAAEEAHRRLQRAVTGLYPGQLVLSLNAEVIYHRLVRKIVELNGVPAQPTRPRTLGPLMCVPFGKILRSSAVPNTVTKTIHTDKVFAPDLRSFGIEAFPGYAPLETQIRMIRSFGRPVVLVDDLLHSGNRIRVLYPLLKKEGVEVDRVLVGLLSGLGSDIMRASGVDADCVYFVPNLRSWFVESTMYPFIGGDTVSRGEPANSSLTPAVNLIQPYAFPRFLMSCSRESVYRFSEVCIENSRSILLTLEEEYRKKYARNLTLSRLSEAVILPLCPDRGSSLSYDPNRAASDYLAGDLRMLRRAQDF